MDKINKLQTQSTRNKIDIDTYKNQLSNIKELYDKKIEQLEEEKKNLWRLKQEKNALDEIQFKQSQELKGVRNDLIVANNQINDIKNDNEKMNGLVVEQLKGFNNEKQIWLEKEKEYENKIEQLERKLKDVEMKKKVLNNKKKNKNKKSSSKSSNKLTSNRNKNKNKKRIVSSKIETNKSVKKMKGKSKVGGLLKRQSGVTRGITNKSISKSLSVKDKKLKREKAKQEAINKKRKSKRKSSLNDQ